MAAAANAARADASASREVSLVRPAFGAAAPQQQQPQQPPQQPQQQQQPVRSQNLVDVARPDASRFPPLPGTADPPQAQQQQQQAASPRGQQQQQQQQQQQAAPRNRGCWNTSTTAKMVETATMPVFLRLPAWVRHLFAASLGVPTADVAAQYPQLPTKAAQLDRGDVWASKLTRQYEGDDTSIIAAFMLDNLDFRRTAATRAAKVVIVQRAFGRCAWAFFVGCQQNARIGNPAARIVVSREVATSHITNLDTTPAVDTPKFIVQGLRRHIGRLGGAAGAASYEEVRKHGIDLAAVGRDATPLQRREVEIVEVVGPCPSDAELAAAALLVTPLRFATACAQPQGSGATVKFKFQEVSAIQRFNLAGQMARKANGQAYLNGFDVRVFAATPWDQAMVEEMKREFPLVDKVLPDVPIGAVPVKPTSDGVLAQHVAAVPAEAPRAHIVECVSPCGDAVWVRLAMRLNARLVRAFGSEAVLVMPVAGPFVYCRFEGLVFGSRDGEIAVAG